MIERFVWHDKQAFIRLCMTNRWIHKLLPLCGEKKAEDLVLQMADALDQPDAKMYEGRELVLECWEAGRQSFESNLYEGRHDRRGFTTVKEKGTFILGFTCELD